MKVTLKTKTIGCGEYENKSLDELIVGIARISSSRETNDLFKEPEKLLRHCLLNQHWSIFSTVNIGIEIETSLAMGNEILRHKSADFQQFSMRYAENTKIEDVEIRKQSKNNRQSSSEVFYDSDLELGLDQHLTNCSLLYNELLTSGVAREVARFVMPTATSTIIYMNGTIRTWLSFLNQRLHKTAQKEIRLIAEEIKNIFLKEMPVVSKMLYDFDNAYDVHIFERLVLEKYKVYDKITQK